MPLTPDALAAEIRKFIPKTGVARRDGLPPGHPRRLPAQPPVPRRPASPRSTSTPARCPSSPRPGEGEGAKLLEVAGRAVEAVLDQVDRAARQRAGEERGRRRRARRGRVRRRRRRHRVLGEQPLRRHRRRVVTHPVGPKVLPGITRAVLLEVAAELGHRDGRAAAARGRGEGRRRGVHHQHDARDQLGLDVERPDRRAAARAGRSRDACTKGTCRRAPESRNGA